MGLIDFEWVCPHCNDKNEWSWESDEIPIVGDKIAMECDFCDCTTRMICKLIPEEDKKKKKLKMENPEMEEYIIKLEKRNGIFPLSEGSYIVPKRVYNAINILLNPTKEGLAIEEFSDNTS